MNQENKMKVFTINDEDWIFAESETEAIEYACNQLGYSKEDFDDGTYLCREVEEKDFIGRNVKTEGDFEDELISFAEHYRRLCEQGAGTQLFASHNW